MVFQGKLLSLKVNNQMFTRCSRGVAKIMCPLRLNANQHQYQNFWGLRLSASWYAEWFINTPYKLNHGFYTVHQYIAEEMREANMLEF